MLAQSSSMSNPYEFRELMKAAFGYSDKTTDQVLAEQERRRNERESKSPSARPSKRRAGPAPATTSNATPRQSEVDKMRALLAGGKPRSVPTGE